MNQVQHAEWFARQAHGDTPNKHDAEPYINHPERVVQYLIEEGCDQDVIVVGWLHDVVEDTDRTLDDIQLHFGRVIRDGVDAITHRPGEPASDYYDRVGQNTLALWVKLFGDLPDNTDPDRRAKLDPETRDRLAQKYFWAYRQLTGWLHYYAAKGEWPPWESTS
jgi:HD domain